MIYKRSPATALASITKYRAFHRGPATTNPYSYHSQLLLPYRSRRHSTGSIFTVPYRREWSVTSVPFTTVLLLRSAHTDGRGKWPTYFTAVVVIFTSVSFYHIFRSLSKKQCHEDPVTEYAAPNKKPASKNPSLKFFQV